MIPVTILNCIIITIMNTPKCTIGGNRSVSPLRGSTSTATKQKYYSAQEVNKIVRSAFEPKIQFLMKELEERQQTIARLNNKLNANDQRLLEQSALLEGFMKRHKEGPQMQAFVINTINQLINDRMKQHWQALGSKIRQIGEQVRRKFDQKKLLETVQTEMEKIKGVVTAFMQSNKQKSNSYWQKIRDALGKINSKITNSEKDILDLTMKIENFQNARMRDRETVSELQNSKNVVKNLVQLKKSVENIYQNYQSVLALQKGLKQRLEEQSGDSLWQEADFFRQKSNVILPEHVDLDYSKEEDERRVPTPSSNQTQPMISPMKKKNSVDQSLSADLLQLQRTTPMNKSTSQHSELFSLNTSQQNPMHSRIQNSTFLINLSLQTRKQMAQGVRERLIELIEAKQYPKPLQIRYDEQINYLKNPEGNYLFDLRGNMFKVPPSQLSKLQEEGLVSRMKRREGSMGKVKLTHC